MHKLLIALALLACMVLCQGCSEASSMANVKHMYPDATIYSRYEKDLLPKYTYVVKTTNAVMLVKDYGTIDLNAWKRGGNKEPMTPYDCQIIKE